LELAAGTGAPAGFETADGATVAAALGTVDSVTGKKAEVSSVLDLNASSTSIDGFLVVTLTANVPPGACKTGTKFRWAQRSHSSAAQGKERGVEGLYYQWRYRELYDQWALDDVHMDMVLDPPHFTSSGDPSNHIKINTITVTFHTKANNVVLYYALIADPALATAAGKPGSSLHSVLTCPSSDTAKTALIDGSLGVTVVSMAFVSDGTNSGGSIDIALYHANSVLAIVCPAVIDPGTSSWLFGSTIGLSPYYQVKLPVPEFHPHRDNNGALSHPHPHMTWANDSGVLLVTMTVANEDAVNQIFYTLSNGSATGYDAYPPDDQLNLLSCASPLWNATNNSEVQTVTTTATAGQTLGGAFILTYDGQPTTELAVASTAAQVKAALEALTTIPVGGVAVVRGTADGVGGYVWTVTWNDAGNRPEMTAASGTTSALTGTGAAVAIATTTAGTGSEVQTVTTTAAAADLGGTFTLTYDGQTTAPAIPAAATASDVKTALEALSTIPVGGVTVVRGTTSGNGYPYTVTWATAGNRPPMTATGTSLSGTSAAVTVAQTTDGIGSVTTTNSSNVLALVGAHVLPANRTISLTSSNIITAIACREGIRSSGVVRSELLLVRLEPPTLVYSAHTGTTQAGILVEVDTRSSVSAGYPHPVHVRYTLSNETNLPPSCSGNHTHPYPHPLFFRQIQGTNAAGAHDDDGDHVVDDTEAHDGFGHILTATSTEHSPTWRYREHNLSYSLVLTSNVRIRAVACPRLVQAHAEQSVQVEAPSTDTGVTSDGVAVFSVALEAPTAFLRCDRFEPLKLHVWLTLPVSSSAAAGRQDPNYDSSVRNSQIHYAFVPATKLAVATSELGGANAVGSQYYSDNGYASEAAEAAALCTTGATYSSGVPREVGAVGAYTPFPPGSAASFFSSSDSSFDSANALPDGSVGGLIFDGATHLDGSLRVVGCSSGNTPSTVIGVALPVGGCCAGAFMNSSSLNSAASSAYASSLLSACASSLLFEDNFSTSCATITSTTTTAVFASGTSVSSSSAFSSASPSWVSLDRQWGGEGINGGVHPDNVRCAYESDTSALLDATLATSPNGAVLELLAHGDAYTGTAPIGTDSSGVARGADIPFAHPRLQRPGNRAYNYTNKGWSWPGYWPAECSAATGGGSKCAVRRVGAAIQTTQNFAWGGVVQLRMKPCATDSDDTSNSAWGTSSGVWLQNATKRTCRTQREYIRLWQAALRSGKAPSCNDWVMTADGEPEKADGRYHDYTFHWTHHGPNPGNISSQIIYHASAGGDKRPTYHWPSDGWGRVALYIDGRLLRTFVVGSSAGGASEEGYSASAYTGLGSTGSGASPLTIGQWFPDAWAGAPDFGTCATRVASVRVMDATVAQERWCTLPRQHVQCGRTSNISNTSAYISSYHHDVGSDYHAGVMHRPPPPVGGGVGHSGYECEVWVRQNCLFEQALPAVGNRHRNVYCETWREQPVCYFGERTLEVVFDPYYDRMKLKLEQASASSSLSASALLIRYRGNGTNSSSSNVVSTLEGDRDYRRVGMYTGSDNTAENGTAVRLTLTTPTAGADIYYTTDGTEPAEQVGGSTLLYDSASPPSFFNLTLGYAVDLAVDGGIHSLKAANETTHPYSTHTTNLTHYKWLRVRSFARQAGLPLSVTTEARYAVEVPESA
jgi:hypothetical protein